MRTKSINFFGNFYKQKLKLLFLLKNDKLLNYNFYKNLLEKKNEKFLSIKNNSFNFFSSKALQFFLKRNFQSKVSFFFKYSSNFRISFFQRIKPAILKKKLDKKKFYRKTSFFFSRNNNYNLKNYNYYSLKDKIFIIIVFLSLIIN